MSKLSSYLEFDGRCAEAFAFYEKALGAKLAFKMTHGESPMAGQVPKDWHSKIMHASLEVGSNLLLGSDVPPGRYSKPQGFSVSISVDTPSEAEKVFSALAAGGTIGMPIAETFWARRFGTVVDRFGIPWMVNCDKPMT